MRYRRCFIPGGTYFFTLATFQRKNILCKPENINILKAAFERVKSSHPFDIQAIVVLPDHLHCIWTLPENDAEYPARWNAIKNYFTKNTKDRPFSATSIVRTRKREQEVWQRRFWEHAIRDDDDFVTHVEYIHFNPVKHGYVKSPMEWAHSSFHKFVRQGAYSKNWGMNQFQDLDLETVGE